MVGSTAVDSGGKDQSMEHVMQFRRITRWARSASTGATPRRCLRGVPSPRHIMCRNYSYKRFSLGPCCVAKALVAFPRWPLMIVHSPTWFTCLLL